MMLVTGVLCLLSVVRCQELVVIPAAEKPSHAQDTPEPGVAAEQVSSDEVFIPTADWQEVQPGQAVPAGLHVRINLQTGKKEAKLLQEENKGDSVEGIKYGALKEAMKKIKADDKVQESGDIDVSKHQHRSMKEIKEELKDVNVKVESDHQAMSRLTTQFHETQSDSEKAVILESLEFYAHHYDAAVDWLQLGGLEGVVVPSLNSTAAGVRQAAALLLGAAVQSNPAVQQAALQTGLHSTLLRLAALDPEPGVAARALFALSATLRNFPAAQESLARQGGLSVLVRTLARQDGRQQHRLRLKILTLISDLLTEQQQGQNQPLPGLVQQVVEAGGCEATAALLVPQSEHETVEVVVTTLQLLAPPCSAQLAGDTELLARLDSLQQEYSLLARQEREEQDGELFTGIHTSLVQLLSVLAPQRTEL